MAAAAATTTTATATTTATTNSRRVNLLRQGPSRHVLPPMFVQPGIENMDSPVTLPSDQTFPDPAFTSALDDTTHESSSSSSSKQETRRMPQCIAHRGYRAAFPENTLAAFKGAVKAGAHALETDVHISKDDVVVISHDATLKRCFGRPEKILDCDWEELRTLRTIAEPHEPMPRLRDLLEYLAQPGLEEIWLLLDIKLDNDADAIMRLLGKTLAEVSPGAAAAWHERVVLGIWAAKFLPLAAKYLPGFPVTHIGFSVPYARHFFEVPNVSFNMLFPILVGPGGKKFLRDAKEKYHRQVYAWTVNVEERMRWCIRRRLDGVITDDPKLFLDVCERYGDDREAGGEPLLNLSPKGYLDVYRIWIWISVAAWFFWSRFTPVASKEMLIQKAAHKR